MPPTPNGLRSSSAASLAGGRPPRRSRTSVFVAGANDHASLGLALDDAQSEPRRVLALRSQFVRCATAAAGASFCSTGDGQVLAWTRGELPSQLALASAAPACGGRGDDDAAADAAVEVVADGSSAADGSSSPLADCCALRCSPTHVVALTDEGRVLMCEYAGEGSLASGEPLVPRGVPLPVDIVQVACGEAHVLALADGGVVFSWGRGVEGQLGRPQTPLPQHDPSPRRIDEHLDTSAAPIAAVACGGVHTILLTVAGEVLGCGPRALLASPAKQNAFGGGVQPVPALIAGPWQDDGGGGDGGGDGDSGSGVRSVACGRAHTLVVGPTGKLYAFGEATNGQLGHAGGGPFARAMRSGGSLASLAVEAVWASPLCDASFARAKAEDGTSRCFMWGLLPGGGGTAWRSPQELAQLRGLDVIDLSASGAHCLALLASGDLFAFGASAAPDDDDKAAGGGSGGGGALGLQRLGAVASPVRHSGLGRHKVVALACGDGPHALALSGGHVLSWGRNTHGELGCGEHGAGAGSPRRVLSGALAARTAPLVRIAAGAHFSLACGVHADDVVGWGDGSKMQLGAGAGGDVLWTPTALAPIGPSEATVVSLVAGAQHAGALLATSVDEIRRSHGYPVLWGCGEHGALGRGGVANQGCAAACRPGSLGLSSGAATASFLTLGRATSAAVDLSGALHLWGRLWGCGQAAGTAMEPTALAAESVAAVTGGGLFAVRHVSCSGRRLLMQCECADGTVVLEGLFGGTLHAIHPLANVPVSRVCASADCTIIITADGQCLRLALDVAGAGANRVDAVALPEGCHVISGAAGRGHYALLVRDAPSASSAPPSPSKSRGVAGAPEAVPPSLDSRAELHGIGSPGSRPGSAAGSRPGTASNKPIWLEP